MIDCFVASTLLAMTVSGYTAKEVSPITAIIVINVFMDLAGIILIIAGCELRFVPNKPERPALGLWLIIAGIVLIFGGLAFNSAMSNGR